MYRHYSNHKTLSTVIFLDNVGLSLYGAIFGVYLYDLNATFTELAMLSAVPSLVMLFLSRYWGIVSDETHVRKPYVIWSKFLRPFFVLTYGLVQEPKTIIIIFVLATILTSPGAPAFNAIITTIGRKEHRGSSIGQIVSIAALGNTIGGFCSAILIKIMPVKTLFVYSFIILLCSALLFTVGYQEEKSKNYLNMNLLKKAFGKAYSAREFSADRELFPLIFSMLVYNIGVTAFFHVFFIKLYLAINRDKSLYAFISSLSSAVSIFAPIIYGRIADHVGFKKLLTIAIYSRALYMIVLAIVWDPLTLMILWVVPIWAAIRVSSMGLATLILGDEKAARAQGTFAVSNQIASIIAPILSGILADYLGVRENMSNATPIYMLGIILCFISAIIVLIKVKEDKHNLSLSIYKEQI